MSIPERKGFRLKPEYEDLYASFDGDCSCHISPPCGSCLDPGNPLQLENNDDAWELDVEAPEPLHNMLDRWR